MDGATCWARRSRRRLKAAAVGSSARRRLVEPDSCWPVAAGNCLQAAADSSASAAGSCLDNIAAGAGSWG